MEIIKSIFKWIFLFCLLSFVFGMYVEYQYCDFIDFQRLNDINSTIANKLYPDIKSNELTKFYDWLGDDNTKNKNIKH